MAERAADDRLTELEIKASFTEDLLEQLNEVIVKQQRQIDRLLAEFARLREQIESREDETPRTLREQIPPHY